MAMMQLSRDSHDSLKDDYVNQEQKVTRCHLICGMVALGTQKWHLFTLFTEVIISSLRQINELRAAIGPISGCGLQYCTDACLRRYLEARNWNIGKSKKMLEETLRWRSTYRPEQIRWHEVAHEGETGKAYRATFHDRHGHTVLVLRPGKQNTSSHDNQLRHLVYLIENAILNVPEGQEQMVWLIDFTGWSLNKAVPIKTARETTNILQSHYPERLYAAFLYNPPRIFETFWKFQTACAVTTDPLKTTDEFRFEQNKRKGTKIEKESRLSTQKRGIYSGSSYKRARSQRATKKKGEEIHSRGLLGGASTIVPRSHPPRLKVREVHSVQARILGLTSALAKGSFEGFMSILD
ncbi:hypothetical protein Taro_019344, partial [Colocasia esculenta]|nr:hypothetical protein [Colocasia esculenta]